MRSLLILFWLSLSAGLLAAQVPEGLPLKSLPQLEDGSLLIEDFEEETPGSLPSRWFNQRGEYVPAMAPPEEMTGYLYRVREEEGNRFLRYEGKEAMHLNFPVREVENLDLRNHPVLSWRWRVHQLPEGGNEDRGGSNDTAASIYVVYGFNWLGIPKVIRYTWSSTLPAGTELSKNLNNQKIVVVASGEENLGEWMLFERNIREDYRRLFGGRPPRRPVAFLILSDGDSTDSTAKADYDDIRLIPARK